MIGTMLGFIFGRVAPALCVALAMVVYSTTAEAQARLPGTAQANPSDTTPALPADLSPEMVDALMARLTDTEIRALLRDELRRRAEERAAMEAVPEQTLADIAARLETMAGTIEKRVRRWIKALGSLEKRRDKVAARLALAEAGVAGMIGAALALGFAGVLAAFATGWLTARWRAWLVVPLRGNYWDRVVRTIALGLVELLPVVAFVAATRIVAPLLAGLLGPLIDFVWIYHAGVSNCWVFIVIARRAFAPDAPAIRIAPIADDAALRIHALLRRAVIVGVAGWLIAGLSPTLGFGFPPAMITVALAGTAVMVILLVAVLRNHARIREAAAVVIQTASDPGAGARIAVAAAPAALATYIAVAYLYWVANWLETGRQHLDGPAGTLIVYLAMPILDRLGREIVGSVLRGTSDAAGRYRAVFHSAWRLLIGIASVFVIARLWGLDLYALAKGEHAPAWADTAFDVGVTVMIVWLIWRLIKAALHTEPRTSSGGESVDPSDLPAATRLDTLTPLFRNILLAFLLATGAMIALSASGVDIGPLLASAGILGIAIGFGAQALVRDVFSGAFFLIDDAFRVGEYIELDKDMRGEVESISIRSLQLRHHKGAVITIPFGEMKHITNHNRDWVIYKMMFRMEPDTDPVKFKKLVKEVGKEFLAHPEHGPKFLEPLKSQGVYMVDDDSALVFRVKFTCKPRMQFVLRREIYHRLREVFAEAGMRLSRRKVEVVSADGASVGDSSGAGAVPEDFLTGSGAPPV